MNEEIKKLFPMEFKIGKNKTLYAEVDLETLNKIINHIESLQQRVEQLENIRKEAITYILAHCEIIRHIDENVDEVGNVNGVDLLNILNKGSDSND